jgi:hypothetical protein
MSPDRKKPGVAFWATVVVVGLPLLYVLSFGPACWLARQRFLPPSVAAQIYRPILWASADKLPGWANRAVWWYGGEDGRFDIHLFA